MQELGPHRLGEALDGVLGAAIGGLEGDAAVGERTADLHDRAPVARAHAPQRGHRAPDEAEIGDLGGAAELVGRDLPHRREDRGHRVVDPDVDRPELRLGPLGRGLDLHRVGHVRGDRDRAPTGRDDLAARALEAVLAASQQRNLVAAGAEGAGRGPAHARARAGDDNGAHADQLPRRGPSYAGASAR